MAVSVSGGFEIWIIGKSGESKAGVRQETRRAFANQQNSAICGKVNRKSPGSGADVLKG